MLPIEIDVIHLKTILIIASVCTGIASMISTFTILGHLRYFNEPAHQKYICRILFMVPIYAVMSYLSIVDQSSGIIFATLRDCYEAYVIYAFFSLLLEYLGGERALSEWLELQGRVSHTWWMRPFFRNQRHMSLGFEFLRWVRKGILQFVFIKPATALAALAFSRVHLYHEGSFSFKDSYLYISIVNNVSVTLSLYCLVLFYVATETILAPYAPVAKFVTVKSVVFFSYWQSCGLQIGYWLGLLKSQEEVNILQGVLICIEMVFASFGLHCAFSYYPYITDAQGRKPIDSIKIENIKSHDIQYRDYDYDDAEEGMEAEAESSSLIPKILHVLDGRDLLKDGKQVFIDSNTSKRSAELSDHKQDQV